MATTEAGHHANRTYTDQDGQIHLNGSLLYIDESGQTLPAAVAEVVTATNVIAASENGRTFFLNSATEFVSTLPAPALGLRFKFVVAAAPSGASYTVVCASAATLIKGQVLTNDVNSGTDADFGTSGEGTLTFVDGKAVAGDWALFECDGTNWFVTAGCSVFDAITIS